MVFAGKFRLTKKEFKNLLNLVSFWYWKLKLIIYAKFRSQKY